MVTQMAELCMHAALLSAKRGRCAPVSITLLTAVCVWCVCAVQRNAALRARVVRGALPPDRLVHLGPADLATESQREQLGAAQVGHELMSL